MPKNENPLTPMFRRVDELREVGLGMDQRRLLHEDQYDHFRGETQIGPNVRHHLSLYGEERRAKASVTIVGDHFYIDKDGDNFEAPITRGRVDP